MIVCWDLAQRRGGAEGVPTCRWGGANRVAARRFTPNTAFTMKSMKDMKNPDCPSFLASWVPA